MPAVSALAVGAPQADLEHLQRIFHEHGWDLGRVRTRGEARAFMDSTPVRVVISEHELPEGGWRGVLEDLDGRVEPPLLVVISRLADESLWAEVLNLGGYDVLAKPLSTEEVERVISAAVRQFDNARQRIAATSSRRVRMAAAG
jgi:DNA-binding response OmpR family regulator